MDEHEKEMYRRIINGLKGKVVKPFKVDVELHRRCNLKCLSCSRRASKDYENLNEISKKIEMPLEKWLEIVEEAKEMDVREWHIAGGGEPMFLPHMTLPVMKRIKSYDAVGIITTNGTLWSKKIIEAVIEMEWDRIHFSIDGPNAEVHDYLRNVPGTFERVVKTIKYFNELKKKYKKNKPMLNINMTLSKKNYTLLPEMVSFAKENGIEFLFVDPLIVYSDLGRKLKMEEKEIKSFLKILQRARELAKKFHINNNFAGIENNLQPELIIKSSRMDEVVRADVEKIEKVKLAPFLKNFLSVPCYKPWFHITIKCDGRVTSCDVPTENGDNIKHKHLEDVWKGEYFSWLRKTLKSRNIPEFCSQCNASHTSQRRKMRLEILKELEPKAFKKLCEIYGAF